MTAAGVQAALSCEGPHETDHSCALLSHEVQLQVCKSACPRACEVSVRSAMLVPAIWAVQQTQDEVFI
jgi:ethanolamine utilization microcompartment shell protein EutL